MLSCSPISYSDLRVNTGNSGCLQPLNYLVLMYVRTYELVQSSNLLVGAAALSIRSSNHHNIKPHGFRRLTCTLTYLQNFFSAKEAVRQIMSRPTVVMVPGAWHQPDIYAGVAAHLSKHGYPTISLPLPSVGPVSPHKDFSGDVTAIRECLEKLVSDDKDVVLVVHSYTGLPGGEAPKGLGKLEREAKGLKGGVVRYVVINGFATPEGYQPVTKENYHLFPEWMKLDLEVRHFHVESHYLD